MEKIKACTFITALFFCFAVNNSPGISVRSETGLSKSPQLPEVRSSFKQEQTKYQYKGAEQCATVCHNNDTMGFQYNSWKDGPHAKAFNVLSSKRAIRYAKKAGIKESPQESSDCLQCHVTGAGLDGSFLTDTYKKEDGVTCEACHKQKFVPKTFLPKETDCLECHNGIAHSMNKLNFRKDCVIIEHPIPKKPEKQLI
jgi:hypothetical protein